MSEVSGFHCRDRASASKRARQSLFAAAASAALAITAGHVNAQVDTEVPVPNGTTSLANVSGSDSSDVTFTNTAYTNTIFSTSGQQLIFGSLDDLDSTQTLNITDSAGSIDLSLANDQGNGVNSNSVGQTTDALYVASGAALNMAGIGITLDQNLPSGTTLNVAGTATFGSLTGSTAFTVNGGGTLYVGAGTAGLGGTGSLGVSNSTTFTGSWTVNSGTLVSSTLGALGASSGSPVVPVTLGTSGGTQNAILLVEGAGGSTYATPLTTASGDTGQLRLAGVNNPSAATPQYSFTYYGGITLNSPIYLGLGANANTNYVNELALRATFNNATAAINIDAGTNTTGTGGASAPNYVILPNVGSASTFAGPVNVLSGAVTVAGSSAFKTGSSTLTISSGAYVEMGNNIYCAGVNSATDNAGCIFSNQDTSGASLYSASAVAGSVFTFSGTITTGAPSYLFGPNIAPSYSSSVSGTYPVNLGTSSSFVGTQIYNSPGLTTVTTNKSNAGFYGGSISGGGGTLNFSGANDIIGGSTSTTAGTLIFNGGGDTFNNAVYNGGGTLLITGNNTFLGVVSAGTIPVLTSSAVALTGGTLTLNTPTPGANTFPAGEEVAVSDGTLSTNNLQPSGTNSGIGSQSTLVLGDVDPVYKITTNTTTVTDYSGTLIYTGPTATTNLIVTGAAAYSGGTFSGATLVGSLAAYPAAGNLTMKGTGTLTLTGQSTYAGTTTLASGTLDLGSADQPSNTPLPSGPIGYGGTINFAGGTLQYSPANNLDYSARFSTASSQKYNVDTNGQTVTFATALTSAGGSLTISDSAGGGRLILNANNTFSGATTINSGALAGMGTLTGAVTVAAAATISPGIGNAANTLTTGAGTINGTANFAINSTTITNDELVSTGAVTLGASSLLNVTDINGQTLATPTTFVLISAASPIVGNFSNFANNAQFTLGSNTYTVEYNPGGLDEVVAYAPEPASLSVFGIGALAMLRRRRRRTASQASKG